MSDIEIEKTGATPEALETLEALELKRAKRREYARRWHAAHPEKAGEYNQKYRLAQRERILVKAASRRKERPAQIKATAAKYRALHPDKIKASGAAYRATYPEKVRAAQAACRPAGSARRSWDSMRQRCTNRNAAGYHLYGGRGIKICARWDSFDVFLADMGERPPGKSIDRIDSEGNYEPSNCRWATPLQQAQNRRPRTPKTSPTTNPTTAP